MRRTRRGARLEPPPAEGRTTNGSMSMSATAPIEPKPAAPPVEKITVRVDGVAVEVPKTLPDLKLNDKGNIIGMQG